MNLPSAKPTSSHQCAFSNLVVPCSRDDIAMLNSHAHSKKGLRASVPWEGA